MSGQASRVSVNGFLFGATWALQSERDRKDPKSPPQPQPLGPPTPRSTFDCIHAVTVAALAKSARLSAGLRGEVLGIRASIGP